MSINLVKLRQAITEGRIEWRKHTLQRLAERHILQKAMTTSNKCPLCGGHKEKGYTTFSADLGDGLVVVRHVPATICNQCGEEWIDNQIAQQLEQIVEEARQKKHQLEVLSL